MRDLPIDLKRFSLRIRFLRAWKGLAVGLCAGAALSALWAALDLFNLLDTTWTWMAGLTASCGMVGILVGLALKTPALAVADSIDRRAHLQDRLYTALERSAGNGAFDEALRVDAQAKFDQLKPSKLFPLRVGRWQGGALGLCLLASCIFLLGNSAFFLTAQQRKDREDMQKAADQIQRVLKPYEDPNVQKKLTPAEKALENELRKFQRELKKGRVDKSAALQKANELEKQADKLSQQNVQETSKSLEEARTAADKMERQALDKAGMKSVPMNMAKMSESERAAAMKSLQQQMSSLLQQLSKPGLTSQQKSDMQSQLQQAQQQMQALQLSKEAQAVLQRMMNDPIYKEIQRMLNQMQQSKQAGGQGKQLSEAELKAMQARLEALLKSLKDGDAMQQYLMAMLAALQKMGGQPQAGAIQQALASIFKIPNAGKGGVTDDHDFHNVGWIQKSKTEEKSQGKTHEEMISGDRQLKGEETYTEIKGPTTVGDRSSIPYLKVLPSYRRKEEQAINRQQIPRDQEKRVKQYFQSLGGG